MNASTMTPTQTALTADFCILRPKKNIITAPKAGKSGISQMWFKKNIAFSTWPLAFSSWLLAFGSYIAAAN
jgi:hypothetical protein